MATSGRRWSKAVAACLRPDHLGSRVRFDGHYGKPGHRRQLYRGLPANGDPPHRFTELLPREEAWHDACESCERPVHLHEGPHAARHYQLVARGIAEALHAVARPAGRGLGRALLAGRLRAAPASAWPATGSLLLDELPFSVRDHATGRFRIAFRVFCAAGFERGRPQLWRLEAFPDASQARWEAFLRALEGAPARVVGGNHYGLNGAVRAAFPDAELYLCEWHLRPALERLMAKIRQEPRHRAAIDALLPRVEAAFTGPSFWRPFVRDALAAEIPRLSQWLEGTGRLVEDRSAAAAGAASGLPRCRFRPPRLTGSSNRSAPRSTPGATASSTASAPIGCSS